MAQRGRQPREVRLTHLEADLRTLGEATSQTDPTFRTTQLYRRLTAGEARRRLVEDLGYDSAAGPSERSLRRKLSALEFKSLFENPPGGAPGLQDKRISVGICRPRALTRRFRRVFKQALSRGGGPRANPCAKCRRPMRSLRRCSASIARRTPTPARFALNADNGPENNGARTQWRKRLVECGAAQQGTGKLACDPPYHSQDNPVERVFGVLENHWNSDPLGTISHALGMAEGLTCKGGHPKVTRIETPYTKGVRLTKKQMKPCEACLERLAGLGKWFIPITAAAASLTPPDP